MPRRDVKKGEDYWNRGRDVAKSQKKSEKDDIIYADFHEIPDGQVGYTIERENEGEKVSIKAEPQEPEHETMPSNDDFAVHLDGINGQEQNNEDVTPINTIDPKKMAAEIYRNIGLSENDADLSNDTMNPIASGKDEEANLEEPVNGGTVNPNLPKKVGFFTKMKNWFRGLFQRPQNSIVDVKPEHTSLGKNVYRRDSSAEKTPRETINPSEKIVYRRNEKTRVEAESPKKAVYRKNAKNRGENVKKTIKGFSTNVKGKFKDNKKQIMVLSGLAVATIGMVAGINMRANQLKDIKDMQPNNSIVEDTKTNESDRTQQENNAILEAQKQDNAEKSNGTTQEQKTDTKGNADEEKLVYHDAKQLTEGSETKQYIAKAGIQYTEDSTGRGRRGTINQDTLVEIYNRAILHTDENGNQSILYSSGTKTWDEYCKEKGIDKQQIEKDLQDSSNKEIVCIQVANTNHGSIFNTYGWTDSSAIQESNKGKENIEGLFNSGSITFGDNTEMLKQMKSEQER